MSDSTVTTNDLESEFPEVSVAVQVTIVSPMGKRSPVDLLQETGFSNPTASITETSKSTVLPCGTDVITSIFSGTVITGAIVSETVIVKDVVLPSAV